MIRFLVAGAALVAGCAAPRTESPKTLPPPPPTIVAPELPPMPSRLPPTTITPAESEAAIVARLEACRVIPARCQVRLVESARLCQVWGRELVGVSLSSCDARVARELADADPALGTWEWVAIAASSGVGGIVLGIVLGIAAGL